MLRVNIRDPNIGVSGNSVFEIPYTAEVFPSGVLHFNWVSSFPFSFQASCRRYTIQDSCGGFCTCAMPHARATSNVTFLLLEFH